MGPGSDARMLEFDIFDKAGAVIPKPPSKITELNSPA